jgi:hypothetical protein
MAKHVTNAAPELAKVIFENGKVRVIELNVKKGSKAETHTHPAYFVYAITPFEYKSTSSGGKKENRRLKKGAADWSDGESHSVEFSNAGRALVVELK